MQLNPKLLLRPKNVRTGSRYYFCPISATFHTNELKYGDEVIIREKVTGVKRGKAVIRVSPVKSPDTEFNTLLSNLAVNTPN